MKNDYQEFLMSIFSADLKEVFSDVTIGFEKESLRVLDSKISQTSHPKALGSALCNENITTDFSEAQLELITPPLNGKNASISSLDEIHYFVHLSIGDEILWPLSIPPTIDSEDDIPIANYGISHLGKLKQIYRNGLSKRYGRNMQTISGFHFNYSLPDNIWDYLPISKRNTISHIRSDVYLHMLRNLFRMNWLLLYLFGSSPIITKNFLKKGDDKFYQLGRESFYMPYATSIRMSDLGYSNLGRTKTFVSLNSINEYANSILDATITSDPRFSKFEKNLDLQLNSNILQIEDEYYAIARAKSNLDDYTRISSKLLKGGIDFIEIRSLDLDPYSRNGIDFQTIGFLEVLLILCIKESNNLMSKKELSIINQNDLLVAKYGRKPGLTLNKDGRQIPLKTWALEILDKMLPIAECMDDEDNQFIQIVNNMKAKISDPALTPSAMLIEKLTSRNLSYNDFGNKLGERNKKYYLNDFIPSDIQHFKDLANRSIDMQALLEKDTLKSEKTFEEYKSDYFQF